MGRAMDALTKVGQARKVMAALAVGSRETGDSQDSLEDRLQSPRDGGGDGGRETEEVEAGLEARRDDDAQHHGYERRVHGGRLALAHDDGRHRGGEEGRRRADRLRTAAATRRTQGDVPGQSWMRQQ